MGEVTLKVLKSVAKLAISFTVASAGTFAGNALYDAFMYRREEKQKQAAESANKKG